MDLGMSVGSRLKLQFFDEYCRNFHVVNCKAAFGVASSADAASVHVCCGGEKAV